MCDVCVCECVFVHGARYVRSLRMSSARGGHQRAGRYIARELQEGTVKPQQSIGRGKVMQLQQGQAKSQGIAILQYNSGICRLTVCSSGNWRVTGRRYLGSWSRTSPCRSFSCPGGRCRSTRCTCRWSASSTGARRTCGRCRSAAAQRAGRPERAPPPPPPLPPHAQDGPQASLELAGSQVAGLTGWQRCGLGTRC